jgi:hypothetical protein
VSVGVGTGLIDAVLAELTINNVGPGLSNSYFAVLFCRLLPVTAVLTAQALHASDPMEFNPEATEALQKV